MDEQAEVEPEHCMKQLAGFGRSDHFGPQLEAGNTKHAHAKQAEFPQKVGAEVPGRNLM